MGWGVRASHERRTSRIYLAMWTRDCWWRRINWIIIFLKPKQMQQNKRQCELSLPVLLTEPISIKLATNRFSDILMLYLFRASKIIDLRRFRFFFLILWITIIPVKERELVSCYRLYCLESGVVLLFDWKLSNLVLRIVYLLYWQVSKIALLLAWQLSNIVLLLDWLLSNIVFLLDWQISIILLFLDWQLSNIVLLFN